MIYPWQESQWQQIKQVADSDRLPHALLLTGAEGMGMMAFVEHLVAYVLCRDAADAASIQALLAAATHPDVRRVRPEEDGKPIKVEAIRELIAFIQLSSHNGRYKIAVLAPAEAMNRSAANALLKTLEEPPANALLVLLSHHPARLAATIRSRCQRLHFPPAETAMAMAWLGSRGLQTQALPTLLALAQGAPLQVLALDEAGTLAEFRQITADLIALKHGQAEAVMMAEKWLAYEVKPLFHWLLNLFGMMVRLKCIGFSRDADKSQINKDLHHLSNALDLATLLGCYDRLLAGYYAATGPYNLNKQGQLEEFIAYWQMQFT